MSVQASKPSLFAAIPDGDEVKLSPLTEAPTGDVDPILFTANETLKGMKVDKAKALAVHVKERIAQIDFNPVLEEGFGSMEEASIVKALQMTMGQFKSIDGFEIVVEGHVLDTLGHFELESPIPVIRPGKSEPEAEPTKPGEDPASTAPR